MTEISESPEVSDTHEQTPPGLTKRSTRKRPGALQGDVKLTLHTLQAGDLLLGRASTNKNPGILTINNFGHDVDQIMKAATHGDIYARQALVNIDSQLSAAERHLMYELDLFHRAISENARFHVEVAQSSSPVVYPLRLTSPYAHWAARLVAIFDEVIAAALTARYVGMLTMADFDQTCHTARKAVRRIFYWAHQFKASGVTLSDIEQSNARAIEAIATHGEILPGILSGNMKPAYLHH